RGNSRPAPRASRSLASPPGSSSASSRRRRRSRRAGARARREKRSVCSSSVWPRFGREVDDGESFAAAGGEVNRGEFGVNSYLSVEHRKLTAEAQRTRRSHGGFQI